MDEEKKRGRPSRGIATSAVLVRFPVELLQRIDARKEALEGQVGVPIARHDVILRLCEQALALEGTPATAAPTTQPAIPLALEPAPTTAPPAAMPQAAEMPAPPRGMINCTAGLNHPPFSLTASECPQCRRNRRARARKDASAPEAPAEPVPELPHDHNTVLQEKRSQPRGPRGVMRQRILTLLYEHQEGLNAEQIRAYLKPEKPIGDTLQGMRKNGVVRTQGSGKEMQYFVA